MVIKWLILKLIKTSDWRHKIMSIKLDALVAAVSANTAAVNAAISALNSSDSTNPAFQAAVDQISANTAALSAVTPTA